MARSLQKRPDMSGETVRNYMTESPITVERIQPMSAAHRLMREHHIRHLPVTAKGRLVGVVSQRDLHFVETLRDVDPDVVLVEEAMTETPYTVGPGARLETVARTMAARRIGSVVVVDRGRVVGLFTATDALRALSEQLAARRKR